MICFLVNAIVAYIVVIIINRRLTWKNDLLHFMLIM